MLEALIPLGFFVVCLVLLARHGDRPDPRDVANQANDPQFRPSRYVARGQYTWML